MKKNKSSVKGSKQFRPVMHELRYCPHRKVGGVSNAKIINEILYYNF